MMKGVPANYYGETAFCEWQLFSFRFLPGNIPQSSLMSECLSLFQHCRRNVYTSYMFYNWGKGASDDTRTTSDIKNLVLS